MRLFVKDLMNLDFSYFSVTEGLVGASFLVDLSLSGSLNAEAMVLDFGLCKSIIKDYINDYIDHKLLLPILSKQINIEKLAGSWLVHCCRGKNSFLVKAPKQAFAVLDVVDIEPDALARHLEAKLAAILPSNIESVRLSLKAESDLDHSIYTYSHGLAKHAGNCQRITHGHRSIINIVSNSSKRADIEKYWVRRWNNKYLGSAQHLQDFTIQPVINGCTLDFNPETHLLFNYVANQGEFSLYIAKTDCVVLPVETTVECLAQYIANSSKDVFQMDNVEVVLYEGINKGAACYL